ncbi:twin-arginine translocase TatA/TatE family subunit, partial [Methylomonas koyamae]|uniref:twin-arginine translocase TatA/TatE family subunit n=2 Tax=Methylomonas TaxID=416 RepID=UPI003B02A69C
QRRVRDNDHTFFGGSIGMGLSVPHLLMILAIVVLVFDTKRLQGVGVDLGEAIKGFRKAVKESDKIEELKQS